MTGITLLHQEGIYVALDKTLRKIKSEVNVEQILGQSFTLCWVEME